MANQLFTNNAATTLASSINNSVTSLTVASGTGALFPSPTGTEFFYCTLSNATGTTIEIVKVTARSTDTFTIVRAQDGTSAQSFTTGDKVELRLVRANLNNFPQLDSANSFAGQQSFPGTTSAIGVVLTDAAETTTISATAATGTINYDLTTQSVLYYTSNASANWTVNFRGNSTTTLNSLMATGQAVTVAFLVTQGATAYYNNAVTVDGSSVTPKYQGGSAWSAGNTSGVDAYVYTIVKTGNAAFTVFASQTQFK